MCNTRETQRRANPRRARALSAAALSAAALLGGGVDFARGINIVLSYDAVNSVEPAGDATGAMLIAIMQHIELTYQDIFEDTHTLTITYRYGAQPAGTLAAHSLTAEGGTPHRETAGTIVFSNTVNWFWDTTPANNSEFDMSQTLWRDLSAAQRDDLYNGFGAAIPSTFEVGFTGTNNGSNPDVAGRTDLLSVAFHETGHALGMSAANDATIAETGDSDYDYDAVNVFGQALAAEIADGGNIAHLDADGPALMNPFFGTAVRRLPGHSDLFAMAGVHDYFSLDVPRREFYGGTNWNLDSNWSGNQVPAGADEVFARAPGPAGQTRTATLSATGYADLLHIMEGSNVNTGAFTLFATTVEVDGLNSDMMVSSGGTLTSSSIVLQNQGQLFMTGGQVTVSSLNNASSSDGIYGYGTIQVSGTLINSGVLQVAGGTMTINATGAGSINLDGSSGTFLFSEPGSVLVTSANSDLVINGSLTDDFNGDMTIGADNSVTFNNPWTLGGGGSGTIIIGSDGVLNLNSGTTTATASLNGATVTIEGDLNVGTNSYGVLNANADFVSGATVVVNTGGVLDLEGANYTFAAGGSYTGGGEIKFDGNTTILGNTTFNIANFNFDGDTILADIFTVSDGATATINGSVTDAFDDNLVVNGTLTVNDSWTNGNNVTLNTGTLAGTGVFTNAASLTVNAGDSAILAPSSFTAGSTNTITGTLRLQGNATIAGGTWSGAGTLSLDDQLTTFTGTTTLNVPFNMDGLINGTGTVNINSGVVVTANQGLTDGLNGTVNVDSGTLVVNAAPWLNAGDMNLTSSGGVVAALMGQPFTNSSAGRITITGGTNLPGFVEIDGAGGPETGSAGGWIDTGSFDNAGTIVVSDNSFGVIRGTINFLPGTYVGIGAGAELSLRGPTTYNGGTYTGPGTLGQETGTMTVAASTTLNVGTYDWDGGDVSPFSTTTLNPGVTFTINASAIDDDGADDPYESSITVNSATLTVNTPSSWPLAGTLNLNNTGTAPQLTGQPVRLLAGGHINTSGASLIPAGVVASNGTINTAAGVATLSGPYSSLAGGVLTKTGAGQLTISGPQSHAAGSTFNTSAGNILVLTDAGAGGANLSINHAGNIIQFNANQHLARLTVGTASIAQSFIPTNDGVMAVNSLAIAGGAAPVAQLNVNDDNLIIKYSGASPLALTTAQLASGFNGGNWAGNGIRSGTAAGAPNNFALGIVEASDIGSPPTYAGEPIDATTLLIAYTRQGDANLDRVTNIADFAILGANFNTLGRWARGDFNYDGTVGIADFSLLAANFNLNVPADLPLARGGLIPEPAAMTFVAAGAMLLRRRRA